MTVWPKPCPSNCDSWQDLFPCSQGLKAKYRYNTTTNNNKTNSNTSNNNNDDDDDDLPPVAANSWEPLQVCSPFRGDHQQQQQQQRRRRLAPGCSKQLGTASSVFPFSGRSSITTTTTTTATTTSTTTTTTCYVEIVRFGKSPTCHVGIATTANNNTTTK
jgi:hypothetical protein